MGLANRLVIGLVTVGVLAACSKSPAESVADALNAVGRQIMAPLAVKDASKQVFSGTRRRLTQL